MKQGILISGSLMAVLLGVGAVSVSPSATAQQLPPPTQPAPVEVSNEQLDRFCQSLPVRSGDSARDPGGNGSGG